MATRSFLKFMKCCSRWDTKSGIDYVVNTPNSMKPNGDTGRRCTGWWFGTFFIFAYIGNNHPNWLIFFRGVETNQCNFSQSIPTHTSVWKLDNIMYPLAIKHDEDIPRVSSLGRGRLFCPRFIASDVGGQSGGLAKSAEKMRGLRPIWGNFQGNMDEHGDSPEDGSRW